MKLQIIHGVSMQALDITFNQAYQNSVVALNRAATEFFCKSVYVNYSIAANRQILTGLL